MNAAPVPAGPPPLRSVHTASFGPLLEHLDISLLVTTYQAGKLVLLRARTASSTRTSAASTSRWAWPATASAWPSAPLWKSGSTTTCRRWPASSSRPAGTTPASCRAPATSPATSRSMRWPGSATNWCSSTPAFPAWPAGPSTTASCRAGGRHSSAPWRPRIAATSTAWACATAVRLRHRPGRDRHAGRLAGRQEGGGILLEVALGRSHRPRPVDAALAALVRRPAVAAGVGQRQPRRRGRSQRPLRRRSPSCPASRAAWTSAAAWPSSACRRCARRPSSAASPSPSARPERCCGVWVVDTVTGQTVAFVKFEDAVQEIFAVQVLPGLPLPRRDQR